MSDTSQGTIAGDDGTHRCWWCGDDEQPERITRQVLAERTTSPASKRLAKELKARGFRFVGPTTAYAFMQAMGLVNDHVRGCDARERVEEARQGFSRPG